MTRTPNSAIAIVLKTFVLKDAPRDGVVRVDRCTLIAARGERTKSPAVEIPHWRGHAVARLQCAIRAGPRDPADRGAAIRSLLEIQRTSLDV
jgi:hypothetical protein